MHLCILSYYLFFFVKKKHSLDLPLLFAPASSDLRLTSPWRQRTACFLPTDTSPIVMAVDSCLRELPWDRLRPMVLELFPAHTENRKLNCEQNKNHELYNAIPHKNQRNVYGRGLGRVKTQ